MYGKQECSKLAEEASREAAPYIDIILGIVVEDMRRKTAAGLEELHNRGRKLSDKYVVITSESVGTSFNKSVADVKLAHPDPFRAIEDVFAKYDRGEGLLGEFNYIMTNYRKTLSPSNLYLGDFLLYLVLLKRMYLSPKWEKAFMIRGVAESYLDLQETGESLIALNTLPSIISNFCPELEELAIIAPKWRKFKSSPIQGVTLGSFAAISGIPLPNKRLLMLPAQLPADPYFKKNPRYNGKGFADNIAAIYLLSLTGLTQKIHALSQISHYGSATSSAVKYFQDSLQSSPLTMRVKASLDSLRKGAPDELAKMLTSPVYLTMPNVAPNDIYDDITSNAQKYAERYDGREEVSEPMVHELYSTLREMIMGFLKKWKSFNTRQENLEAYEKRCQILGVPKEEGEVINLRPLLEKDGFEGLESFPDDLGIGGELSIDYLHYLLSIGRLAWKEREKSDWLDEKITVMTFRRRKEIPLFKFLFYHSPQIPYMLRREEWDKYMKTNDGNFFIVNKRNEMGTNAEWEAVLTQRFREEDFLLHEGNKTFLARNIREIVSAINVKTFMSLQNKLDTFWLAEALSARIGTLGQRIEDADNPDVLSIWKEKGQSPLEIVLSRLREDPPLISEMKHMDEGDIIFSNFALGLLGRWFDPRGSYLKDNVKIDNDAFDVMTAPIGFGTPKGPKEEEYSSLQGHSSEEKVYFSLFDIVLGRASRFGSALKQFDNPQVLVDLIKADRYWDIPINPLIHLKPVIPKTANEKRFIESPYSVFDRLLEMLIAAAMTGRNILRGNLYNNPSSTKNFYTQFNAIEDVLITKLYAKGPQYLNTATGKFFSTKTRREAIGIMFPGFESKVKVRAGLESSMGGPAEDEDGMDVFDRILGY